jgi:hypothetical protein
MDLQVITLTATASILAVAAIRARLDAMGPSWRVGWALTPAGRAQLAKPARRRRTAAQLAQAAAEELALAVAEGRTWDAHAWTLRLARLARTVRQTEARRARYQRQRTRRLERAADVAVARYNGGGAVDYDPEALPAVAS